MSITVAEALKIGALRKCKLLAGARSVDNVINFVDSMEVPDITPWLKSNELLVTTGYSIKDDLGALVRLIESLKQVKAAGLAIKSRFVGQIPKEIIQLADRLDLPLIEIPEDVPFIQITHPLMKAIASRQTMNLEFSETVHRELTKVELEGKGFGDIADTLHSLIGSSVLILDRFFHILASSGPLPLEALPTDMPADTKDKGRTLRIPRQRRAEMRGATGTSSLSLEGCATSFKYRPARAKDKVYGYILVAEGEKSLKELELIALEHATTTTCLEFVKQELVSEQLKVVEHDFFTDLIAGGVHSEPEARQRARMLGWPQPPWIMALIDIDGFSSIIAEKQETEIQALKDDVSDIIRQSLSGLKDSMSMLTRSDSFIILFSEKASKQKPSLADRMSDAANRVKEERKIIVTCGLSDRIDGITGIPAGFEQASVALKVARLSTGGGGVRQYGQIALERALISLSDNEPFRQYYSEVIGKIEKYDEGNGSELFKTLKALVECMGAKSRASQILFIHRNTLAYRIRQIEEIVGLDLSKEGNMATLAMLLRAKPFIS